MVEGGDNPLSLRQATEAIKAAIHTDCIRISGHAEAEMRADNLDRMDVASAIRLGRVVRRELEDTKVGWIWRYTLEGPVSDPDEARRMAVVFEVPSVDNEALPIVTVWEVKQRIARRGQ